MLFFALLLTRKSFISPPSRAGGKHWESAVVTVVRSEMDVLQVQTAFPPCAEHGVIEVHLSDMQPRIFFSREMPSAFPALLTLGEGLQSPV